MQITREVKLIIAQAFQLSILSTCHIAFSWLLNLDLSFSWPLTQALRGSSIFLNDVPDACHNVDVQNTFFNIVFALLNIGQATDTPSGSFLSIFLEIP